MLSRAPRPDSHPWIRQTTFGVDADLQTDMENRLLTGLETTFTRLQVPGGDR